MGAHLLFWLMLVCLVALAMIGIFGLIRMVRNGTIRWHWSNAVHAWMHHAVEAVSPVVKNEEEAEYLHPDLHEEHIAGRRGTGHGEFGAEPHHRYHRETHK